MVGVIAERETVVQIMVWVVAEPETFIKFRKCIKFPEALIELNKKSQNCLRHS